MNTITEILSDAQARWAAMNPYDEGDHRLWAAQAAVEAAGVSRANRAFAAQQVLAAWDRQDAKKAAANQPTPEQRVSAKESESVVDGISEEDDKKIILWARSIPKATRRAMAFADTEKIRKAKERQLVRESRRNEPAQLAHDAMRKELLEALPAKIAEAEAAGRIKVKTLGCAGETSSYEWDAGAEALDENGVVFAWRTAERDGGVWEPCNYDAFTRIW